MAGRTIAYTCWRAPGLFLLCVLQNIARMENKIGDTAKAVRAKFPLPVLADHDAEKGTKNSRLTAALIGKICPVVTMLNTIYEIPETRGSMNTLDKFISAALAEFLAKRNCVTKSQATKGISARIISSLDNMKTVMATPSHKLAR